MRELLRNNAVREYSSIVLREFVYSFLFIVAVFLLLNFVNTLKEAYMPSQAGLRAGGATSSSSSPGAHQAVSRPLIAASAGHSKPLGG